MHVDDRAAHYLCGTAVGGARGERDGKVRRPYTECMASILISAGDEKKARRAVMAPASNASRPEPTVPPSDRSRCDPLASCVHCRCTAACKIEPEIFLSPHHRILERVAIGPVGYRHTRDIALILFETAQLHCGCAGLQFDLLGCPFIHNSDLEC